MNILKERADLWEALVYVNEVHRLCNYEIQTAEAIENAAITMFDYLDREDKQRIAAQANSNVDPLICLNEILSLCRRQIGSRLRALPDFNSSKVKIWIH